jgi:16S rRNA (guanine527-N7)-methyltransferase
LRTDLYSSGDLSPALLAQAASSLGLPLSDDHLVQFLRYYQELLVWNERANLTRIVEWDAVQVEHFLDSLSGVLVLSDEAQRAPCRIVDIGAGAGFPGLPLRIVLPHVRLTLIESVGKKATFLQHLVEALGLADVAVLKARAEEAGRDPAHREAYDLAVARAVASLSTLLEYALPLVRPGGFFVAYKGREVGGEVDRAAHALEVLGGRLQEVRPVALPGLEAPRHLVVVEKVMVTPERYPRRPGMPAKRPLG